MSAAAAASGRPRPAGWLSWLAMAGAVGAAVVVRGLRRSSWRRPARGEFVRFLELTAWRSLPAVTGAAVLVGIGLVGQGIYWSERIGDRTVVFATIVAILIREVAPLVVGLLVIGRGGLLILAELGGMQRDGQCRALDAQGIDPFLVVAMPRVLALPVAMFCLSISFIIVALAVGYLMARWLGIATVPYGQFVETMLRTIGTQGYLVLPGKSLLIGLAIGVVCVMTAAYRSGDADAQQDLVPIGFLRAVLATFLATGLVSAL